MNWKPVYVLLLLTSTLITYAGAMLVARQEDVKHQKIYLTLGIVLNVGILFFFKYYSFAAANITMALQYLGIKLNFPEFNILLPIGISFYTFQAIGYLIDVYREDTVVERNFFRYALFISFFPQLVAGPIERSYSLMPQFKTKHTFNSDMAISGLKLIIWGFFMKLVVSGRCAMYVDNVFNNLGNAEGYSTLIAGFLFPFQLYGDFAGYTFIAIGAAKIMGFTLMDNFRRPYLFATSVQDYWKRNHISLTTWFMDYIYYPFTEYKNTIVWWCFCIFITFLISGFWHGAAWTFVIWGALQGILLVVEMLTNKRKKKFEKRHKLKNRAWYLWSQRIITFVIITLTLVFFRANSLTDAFQAFNLMFTPSDLVFDKFIGGSITAVLALVILLLKDGFDEYKITRFHTNKHKELRDDIWMISIILCIAWLGVVDGGEFIYFQF